MMRVTGIRFYLVACSLLLAACSQPKALLPQVSSLDQEQEIAHQQNLTQGKVRLNYDEVSYNKADKDRLKKRLQAIATRLAPEATTMCRELNGPDADCNMHVVLSGKDKGLNAKADGEKIVINAAMVDFTSDAPDQLAFVLAHEYVHHMMGHVDSTKYNVMGGGLLGIAVDVLAATQGIETRGQFGQLGAQAALLSYSPDFEQEADYMALYMLERAGFDIEKAPDFWRRMAQYNPRGIYTRTTHPTNPERFVLMQKTIDEIHAKRQIGARLLPNMQPET